MTKKVIIVAYPGAMRTAIYGLQELFDIANSLFDPENHLFEVSIQEIGTKELLETVDVLILPPSVRGRFHEHPDPRLLNALRSQHERGTLLCSICVGAFILASTGLLDGRIITTHWGVEKTFNKLFPMVQLDVNRILIIDGSIWTAGGLMAWMDLGLEMIRRETSPSFVHQLGRHMIVDTSSREQRSFRVFQPNRNHTDEAIHMVQNYLKDHFSKSIDVPALAHLAILGQRTFLRRFKKATGMRPLEYVQHHRVQNACDLIVQSSMTVEEIAWQSGYRDISSFRRVFFRIVGMTPTSYRAKWQDQVHKESGY